METQNTELETLNKEFIISYTPMIAVMAILCVVGVFGNSAVIYFFGFKNNNKTATTVLVSYLGVFDLVVSMLLLSSIADSIVNVYYSNRALCKLMYFVDECFMLSSVFTLWLISIDRYIKVCRPMSSRKITTKSAKTFTAFAFLSAMALASRTLYLADVEERHISRGSGSVTVWDCANSADKRLMTIATVSHIVDAVFLVFVLFSFIFTYGNILKTIRHHNRRRKSNVQVQIITHTHIKPAKRTETPVHTELQSSSSGGLLGNITDAGVQEVSTSGRQPSLKMQTSVAEEPASKPFVKNVAQSKDLFVETNSSASSVKLDPLHGYEKTLTIMMFVVSLGLLLCFLPFVAWSMIIVVHPELADRELEPGIQFLLRSPFWNSVINPLIFLAFNPGYRRFVKNIFIQC